MKKRACAILLCLIILGCGDDAKMETAINATLQTEPALCFRLSDTGTDMPVTMAAPASNADDDSALNPVLLVARDTGFVTVARVKRPFQSDIYTIALTESGKASHIWDKASSSMCIGNLVVASIEDWVEATTPAGTGRKVTVTVKRANVPQWASDKAFDATYKQEQRFVLQKTENDWIVKAHLPE